MHASPFILALLVAFFFLYVGIESGYGAWLYTYALTTGMAMPEEIVRRLRLQQPSHDRFWRSHPERFFADPDRFTGGTGGIGWDHCEPIFGALSRV